MLQSLCSFEPTALWVALELTCNTRAETIVSTLLQLGFLFQLGAAPGRNFKTVDTQHGCHAAPQFREAATSVRASRPATVVVLYIL